MSYFNNVLNAILKDGEVAFSANAPNFSSTSSYSPKTRSTQVFKTSYLNMFNSPLFEGLSPGSPPSVNTSDFSGGLFVTSILG